MQVSEYLLRRLREIGALVTDSDAEHIIVSAKQLQNVKLDDLAEKNTPQDEGVSAEGQVAFVKRERLINLEDYEHDSLEVKRPVLNTDDAIDAQIQALDLRLDIWEMRAKAGCTKRRIEAREQERRVEEQARDAEENEMVTVRVQVCALLAEHPDWTPSQVLTEFGDNKYRARQALHDLMSEGGVIRDREKGVWRFLEQEEKEEQGEQSDPSVF